MLITKSISHEEYLRKKRKKKLWKLGITFFLIILIIGIASYISHRQEIRVSKIELNGGILVTQADIESKALEYMYGSHLWLFPKNNAFWYPHSALEEYLKETFKRIDTININLKGFQTLIINITERKPFAIWCNSPSISTTTPVIENKSEDCYFIDQNSTVFAKAPTFSGDAYFKYYGLIFSSENELPIGKEYIASTTEFNEISDFVLKAKELLIRPIYLIAKDNGEFSLVLSGGGEIYFDMKESLSIVGQNLEALLRIPIFASSTGNLPIEYIDLRYGNKLFYKLKSN
ncbi:MAG: hypothetical protein NTX96_03390 [Candidatus Zambryskibacteria bacterium]|nr:hypothetical protein [Candidatus Zambryskibacteria bacterium]